MELVRNNTKDGSCKYALIRLDKMRKDGTFKNIEEFLKLYPELKEYIEFGEPHSEEEFFVIKLKDINSTRALTAYVFEAEKSDPEFALEVMDLALRSGKRHRKCKQPDLLQTSDKWKKLLHNIKHGDYNRKKPTSKVFPTIPPPNPNNFFKSPPDGRYLMFASNERDHNGRKPDNLEDSEINKNTRETIIDYPHLNLESLDFPKQNGKASETYDKLLEQQHELEHVVLDVPKSTPPPPAEIYKSERTKGFWNKLLSLFK